MFEFILPDIGEGIAEAEIVRWFVKPGDAVHENQVIAEVLTDKATVELSSPVTGKVHSLSNQEGAIVKVGSVFAVFEVEGGTAPKTTASEHQTQSSPSFFEFILPDIGEGIAEAEIVRWFVKPGDAVHENQVIAEVLTDKATVELSSPVTGEVHSLSNAEGSIVQVGEIFATFKTATESTVKSSERKAVAPQPFTPNAPIQKNQNSPAQGQGIQNLTSLATPTIQAYADSLQIDLSQVKGTGPRGRILRKDVDEFLAGGSKNVCAAEMLAQGAPMTAPSSGTISPSKKDPDDWQRKPLRGLRRTIAQRMIQAKRTAAHYTYVEEIDMTNLEALRAKMASPVSPLSLIVYACARVLREFSEINISMDEVSSEIIYKQRIHLGVAIDTEDGLVVPVLQDTDQKEVSEIAKGIKDLAERARHRKLKTEELSGGTFTISSLGKLGGVFATPILNLPESAILGVHAIRTLPRYVGQEILPRQIMNLSITLDHRLVDGAAAAKFMAQLKEFLETPKFTL